MRNKIFAIIVAFPLWLLIMWGLAELAYLMINLIGVVGIIIPLGIGIFLSQILEMRASKIKHKKLTPKDGRKYKML